MTFDDIGPELKAEMVSYFKDEDEQRHWFKMGNSILGGSPQSYVETGEGSKVVSFLRELSKNRNATKSELQKAISISMDEE